MSSMQSRLELPPPKPPTLPIENLRYTWMEWYSPFSWKTGLPTGVFSERLNRDISPVPGTNCGGWFTSWPAVRLRKNSNSSGNMLPLLIFIAVRYPYPLGPSFRWCLLRVFSTCRTTQFWFFVLMFYFCFFTALCSRSWTGRNGKQTLVIYWARNNDFSMLAAPPPHSWPCQMNGNVLRFELLSLQICLS